MKIESATEIDELTTEQWEQYKKIFIKRNRDMNEVREFLIYSLAVMDEKGKPNLGDNSYMLWQRDWEKLRMSIFKSLELLK